MSIWLWYKDTLDTLDIGLWTDISKMMTLKLTHRDDNRLEPEHCSVL